VTTAFCLLLTAMLLGDSQNDKVKAADDYVRFEGVWRFELVEVEGVKQPAVPFATNKIIIRADGSYVVVQGQRKTKGKIDLDPTKNPKHFDVTITDGPAKGQKFSAIYQLDGDTYKFCGALRKPERPSRFHTAPGSGTMLQVLKREKQSVKEALSELSRRDLNGNWRAVSLVVDGKKSSEESARKTRLSFDTEGRVKLEHDGDVAITGTAKIDGASDPMTIDLSLAEGDKKVKDRLGIYQCDGVQLTICLAASGKPRPKQFLSERGSGNELTKFERLKPAETR
jgi:uncharacterized protein (TIGR03067 family)